MPLAEDTVREALKQVIDPELFVNIVDLGLIYVIDVVDKEIDVADKEGEENQKEDETAKYNVNIEMTMTSPMCPAGPQLVAECKKFAGELEQVDNVEVKVVMEPQWTPDLMTEDAKDKLGIF